MNSMKTLRESIMSEIEQSMKTDVLKTVQTRQMRSIAQVVYHSYSPKTYERRYGSGGLVDRRNIIGDVKTSGNTTKLSVQNITKYNTSRIGYDGNPNEYLTPLIVLGHGYGGEYSWYPNPLGEAWKYARPRNFIRATELELYNSNAHVSSLKKSLSKKGITVQ